MIEMSEREEIVLKNLMNKVNEEGWVFSLSNGMCGTDLSFIENALIMDILNDYCIKERENNG